MWYDRYFHGRHSHHIARPVNRYEYILRIGLNTANAYHWLHRNRETCRIVNIISGMWAVTPCIHLAALAAPPCVVACVPIMFVSMPT